MRLRGKNLKSVFKSMADIYWEQHVPRAAAGLSYFLTWSVFPLLICLYNMLGGLFPATEEIRSFLTGLLPENTTEIILDFLRYVSENTSTTMLIVALTVLVTSSSAAFRTMDNVFSEMRGRARFSGFFEVLFSIAFSVVFLAALYFAAILILTGKWFLDFVDRHIMFMNISDSWSWARFVLLGLLLFVILSGLYRITAPKGASVRLLPGAVLGALALVAVSVFFSAIIGQSARYPLVYGSLASVIVMMFWLYTCGIILLMGNALNISLERLKADSN